MIRLDDIQKKRSDLRKEGERKRNSFIHEFLWWCAGADKPLLRMCPNAHHRYTILGLLVLVNTILAWLAGCVVMMVTFTTIIGTIIFASVFAVIVFSLYRFTTISLRSDGKVEISRQEVKSNLFQIILAIVIGVAIAIPLELALFQPGGGGWNRDLNQGIAALNTMATSGYSAWFVSWGGLGSVIDLLFHKWWWYLVCSAQGWCTLLVIILNLCPIMFKMMSADGEYERLSATEE